jgi:hypothetical protein
MLGYTVEIIMLGYQSLSNVNGENLLGEITITEKF